MPSGLIRATVLRFDAAMQQTKQAAVEFSMHWRSADASHAERLYFEKINFWRDFFPGTLGERLAGLPTGGVASQSFAPGELLPAFLPAAVHAVRAGRFYPRGMFSGVPDVYAGDLRPLRYLGEADGTARVDLNHPLARCPLHIEGHIVQTLGLSGERGGRSHDIVDELTRNGPGMQVPHLDVSTDFTRLALVLDYFRRSGFSGLGTETARDWPRPPDDPHACSEQSRRAGQFAFADPLFAAWGRAG